MNRQIEQRQWFDDILAQNSQRLADSDQVWLNTARQQARERFAHLQVPRRKQEAWRYTDLDDLYTRTFYSQAEPVTGLDEGDIEDWIYPAEDSYRLVFANGQCVPALSNIQSIPAGIKLGSLRAALSTDGKLVTAWLSQNSGREGDVFTELNRALMNDGLFIHVPANIELTLPIEVVYLNLSFECNTLSQPHSLVILEDGARATLVERFLSTGDSAYFFNGMSEISVGKDAALNHYRLQAESAQAHHLSRVSLRQDTASEYRGMQITTGGAWSRTDYDVHFDGSHASCDVRGVYTVGDGQNSDVHLDVRHTRPACRSREDFRGIVYGKGRAVFDGRVVVAKDAQKSDALLTNKNLLMCEDAEVDTKPQLEIYADDVKCGHGTTVGRLDPDQIYYLRSRGIGEHEAQRMLSMGFAEQVLEHVTDERLHDAIVAQISTELNQSRSSS